MSVEPRTTASRFELWLTAMITRALARDVVDGTLDPDAGEPGEADPAAAPASTGHPGADVLDDRA